LRFFKIHRSRQKVPWKWWDDFFENGGLLTYLSVSQIFEFGFGTRVRSLPDALRLATPKKSLPGAGGGFLTSGAGVWVLTAVIFI